MYKPFTFAVVMVCGTIAFLAPHDHPADVHVVLPYHAKVTAPYSASLLYGVGSVWT